MDPIADYITLYSADAIQNGSSLVWNLNPEYQFQNRGQYCLVSIAKAAVLDTDQDTNVVVVYKDGQNASSSTNNGAALGILQVTYTHNIETHHAYFASEPVKYLTRARPTQIELNTTTLDKTAITINEAVFVLKFEYLKTEEAQATTLATMYT